MPEGGYEQISALLEPVRGALGLESSIDLVLRLVYVRASEPSVWRSAVEAASNGLSPEPALLAADDLDGLADDPRLYSRLIGGDPTLSRLVMELDGFPHARLASLFEEILDSRLSTVGRYGQESASARWMNDLEVLLVGPVTGSVHDPACGFGGGLLSAAQAGATELSGVDIVRSAVAMTAMRLALHGYRADLRVGDSLRELAPRPVDRVVSDPPFGVTLAEDQIARWRGAVKKADDAGAWLAHAFDCLGEGGVAAVLTATRRLARSEVFVRLAESGAVEAVVQLPIGAIGEVKVPTSLVVLRREPASRAEILALDLTSHFHSRSRTSISLSAEGLAIVTDLISRWRSGQDVDGPPHVAVRVARGDVATQGFPPRFAEPPEVPVTWPEPAARLVRRVRICNFKSLANDHDVAAAPLTLIYGPNSVGKSSIIQALLLMLQSVRTGEFQPNGELARLGTYAGLVSGHDVNLPMVLGLDFGIVPPWPGPSGDLHPRLVRRVELKFSSDERRGGRSSEAAIGFAGARPMRARRDVTQDAWSIDLDSLDGWAELLDDLDQAFVDPRRADSPKRTKYRRLTAGLNRVLRTSGALAPGDGALLPTIVSLPSAGYQTVDPVQMLQQRLNRALMSMSRELERLGNSLVYLGPIRPAPERFSERLSSGNSVAADYASFLYDNRSAVDEVNSWLERLGIPYSVDVLPVTAGAIPGALGDYVTVVLTDLRSGVRVSPADVGYGVSQALPIVVQCLRATGSLVLIEQPELHLHPRLQANLGELLIEATKASGAANQIIAETHSEHMLLRVQRLVREGSVSPDDVAVVYVDQSAAGETRVQRLRLGPHGEFLDPWPTGFFDDGIDDVMGGWE